MIEKINLKLRATSFVPTNFFFIITLFYFLDNCFGINLRAFLQMTHEDREKKRNERKKNDLAKKVEIAERGINYHKNTCLPSYFNAQHCITIFCERQKNSSIWPKRFGTPSENERINEEADLFVDYFHRLLNTKSRWFGATFVTFLLFNWEHEWDINVVPW